jgi:hypothetical protein
MWGTVDGVKKWLPEVQGAVFDEELYALLVSASIIAEIELKKVVDPDALPSDLVAKVGDIVEELAAGYFRFRRQRENREYIDDANSRLQALIQSLRRGVYAV